MLNPLKAVGHFIKHIAVTVAHGFVKLFGSDTAHAFAVAAESLLKSQLGAIVWSVVSELAGLQIPGADKRSQALARIASEAEAAGITVENSLINMLIEIAVQKVYGTFGPAPEGAVEPVVTTPAQ